MVKISVLPQKGQANKPLIRLLAVSLNVAQRDTFIVSGHGSQDKVVDVRGVDDQALEVLGSL
jgi:uncharacterized protein YggU (UPF0235/DUF167 family)